MKFKIRKVSLESALSLLKKDDHTAEIELEPIVDTATQAIYEQELRNKAFQAGMERGYREGFNDGRYPERKYKYCQCNCSQ